MRNIIIMCLLMLGMSTPVLAQSCDDDSISSVSADGSIIVTISGSVFQVDLVDQVSTMLWLPADNVLTCNDTKMINVDEDGEHAAVVRLR